MGGGGVGKSAITVRFVQGVFVETYDPTIEDGGRPRIELENKMFFLEILDTAGTEQFTAIRDLFMKDSMGFIFVFSVTAKSTFLDLPDLINEARRIRKEEFFPMVIVGNKIDLESERVVSKSDGIELSKRFDCPYIETSAKTPENIHLCFKEISSLIVKAYIDLSDPKKDKKCCSF